MCIFPYFCIIYFYFHMWIYCCISEPLVSLQDYFSVVDLKPHYSKNHYGKKMDEMTKCNVKGVADNNEYYHTTLQFPSAPLSLLAVSANCFGFLACNSVRIKGTLWNLLVNKQNQKYSLSVSLRCSVHFLHHKNSSKCLFWNVLIVHCLHPRLLASSLHHCLCCYICWRITATNCQSEE